MRRRVGGTKREVRQLIMVARVLAAFAISQHAGCQRAASFPEWPVGQRAMGALWDSAPIAAVGGVEGVRLVGVQPSPEIGWPIQYPIEQLYWCKGTFRLVQVIKGELARDRIHEFLWASVRRDCPLQEGVRQARANIWLLRTEGGYLRPLSDVGEHWAIRSGSS